MLTEFDNFRALASFRSKTMHGTKKMTLNGHTPWTKFTQYWKFS